MECRGTAFQNFFGDVMERAYPAGDFVRVRPWGNLGDRKNDGYIFSKRQLFALHAPGDSISAAAIVKKMKTDFTGAIPHWKAHFDHFTFVHNDITGTGPTILSAILEMRAGHPHLEIDQWGRQAIQDICMDLSDDQLTSLFPGIPTFDDFMETPVSDMLPLLEKLTIARAPRNTPIRPVPQNKLDFNMLSESTQALYRLGISPANRVRQYFSALQNQVKRDRIAQTLREEYERLEQLYRPDEVYIRLKSFVTRGLIPSPEVEVTAYGVLTYFFEECEIFLAPQEEEAS
jgi:hypothetical protein